MDVDMMKSSSAGGEEQMGMMTKMMQIEKLPGFCEPFHNATSSSSPSALKDMQISNGNPANIYHDPHQSSLGSINATPAMPFMGTPIPEPNFVANKFKYEPPNFSTPNSLLSSPEKKNSTAAIREMIFRMAAMQPIHIDPESIKRPKRRNVKISKDPQSVAARHRRERISERIRILQRLVPGGTKMDTASMLDEAVHYLKFLKKQVQTLEQAGANRPMTGFGLSGMTMPNVGYSPLFKNCAQPAANMVGSLQTMLR